MRLAAPTVHRQGGQVVLRAAVSAAAGLPVEAVSLAVEDRWAGGIDPTATPFLPVATLVAAALGEDLHVDGPAAPRTADAARDAVAVLAGFWGWRVPDVAIAEPVGRTAPADRGRGLFFTRGVDSWWALSQQLDVPGAEPPTHLLFVAGAEPLWSPARQVVEREAVARTAEGLGLPLLAVTTDVRRLLDRLEVWDRTHGAALATVAHLLAPTLATVDISSSWGFDPPVPWGSHADVDPRFSDDVLTYRYLGPRVARPDKVAWLVQHRPSALTDLKVCWEGDTARNCGRCIKCIRTMAMEEAAGAGPLIAAAFDHPLDPVAIRALDTRSDHGLTELALTHLRPERVEVCGALRSILPAHERAPAWYVRAGAGPALTGPDVATRLAPVVHDLGVQVLDGDHATEPQPDPDDPSVRPVPVGWRTGELPLRPHHADRHRIRAALARRRDRPTVWAVVEHHDPDARHHAGQALLAAALHHHLGPGLCYLPGVPWAADPTAAGLPSAAVDRLLAQARTRLWWRDDGGLDPLRLVESLEAGCRPVQVMPGPEARALRPVLPDGLGDAVAGDDELADLADQLADPAGDAGAVARVAAVALAGSVERDVRRWAR